MMCSKTEIRQTVRARVKALSGAQRTAQSEQLLTRLEKHPLFLQARVVMMYCSLPDEVCTHRFIQKWGREKIILLPVVQGKNLELRTFVSLDKMETSAFHIDAPQGPAFLDFSSIDLIVVPGVAFTLDGSRLGRGGGYYDRFLSRPEIQHAATIGICFPCQLLDRLPVEPHDVRMDHIIGSLPSLNSSSEEHALNL